MLLIVLWWISTSKGASLNYGVLVGNVQETFDDCLTIIDDARDYIDKVDKLDNVRRRLGKKDDDLAPQLGACVSMLKAMDAYRGSHSRLVAAPTFVRWKYIVYLDTLLKPLSKKIETNPLYVASKDGNCRKFHEKCDRQGATVTIIKTTTGNVFGGYTDKSWNSDDKTDSSSTSFLFQLQPNFVQYPLHSNERRYAVYQYKAHGPIFGRGYDISVHCEALTNEGSVSGRSYTAAGHTLNNGKRLYQAEDYVVFKAIPL